jgi:lysine biosynthesis protein LysW
MTTEKCPICHSDVIIEDDVYENDLVSCVNCGADLEIVSLVPLVLEAIDDDMDEEATLED